MVNFSFDLSDTIKEFHISQPEVDGLCDYVLDRVVDEFMSKWLGIVDSSLNTTRDEYKRAMYTDRPDNRTAVIGLTARESKLAMMIETGADVFDEKLGFKNSAKKKEKKDGGWYLTIPFRHSTSDSIMSLMLPDYGVSVLDLLKSGHIVSANDLPSPLNEPEVHEIKLNTGSLITYKHKAPIFEGLHRRNINSTQKEKRGGYFTFRRVSDKSEDESWIHPGFSEHNLMGQALQDAQLMETVSHAVDEWLELKGF